MFTVQTFSLPIHYRDLLRKVMHCISMCILNGMDSSLKLFMSQSDRRIQRFRLEMQVKNEMWLILKLRIVIVTQ